MSQLTIPTSELCDSEHTAEVFGEWLGMSADDFEMLRAEGVEGVV